MIKKSLIIGSKEKRDLLVNVRKKSYIISIVEFLFLTSENIFERKYIWNAPDPILLNIKLSKCNALNYNLK